MNCFDCAWRGHRAAAVGICADCRAGIGPDQVRLSSRWLTRTAVITGWCRREPS